MTAATGDSRVFDEVVAMLTEVIGADFLLEIDVTPESSFSDDLAVESVEFVALGQKLQQRYGEDVNFVAFVADLDIDQITAMNVGTVVSYIETCLSETAALGADG
ncbi:phosphopantetheine-binding protein [Antrihabitans sp. YC2-6]|uniref:phosphopantetheine-binding protein n=1 Tax=Antrihabitans sp. YC2-6 TaxID=2799498 RepID=UPI0018F587E6|nr:phosphopantetheine-binding protein [Antrihabitans sp. YC2-6]MBJ8348318.1 acyl carrier protein [Antrihabitans sp. YC2-6]